MTAQCRKRIRECWMKFLSRVMSKMNNHVILFALVPLRGTGGYDDRVAENVEHLDELKAQVTALGLDDFVDFRRNIADGIYSYLSRLPYFRVAVARACRACV